MAPRSGWGGDLKRAGRSCYNADYLGMGPRAGGGAGIINYQPGPAGRPARGGAGRSELNITSIWNARGLIIKD